MFLPFVDQNAMFASKDTTTGVPVYMCPGRGRPLLCTGGSTGAWTDYFINPFLNDPNGVPNAPDKKVMLVRIQDGTSNTIAVGHGQINPDDYSSVHAMADFTDSIFNGGSRGLCRPNTRVVNSRDSSDPPSAPGNWGGPFAQGAGMCLLDGTVRFFPYTMPDGVIANGVGPPCGNCGGDPPPCSMASYLTPNGGEVGSCPD